MVCKLKRFYQFVFATVLWAPLNAFTMQAEKTEPLDNGTEAKAVDSVEDEADLALIEFLGQWETDDGEWLAPSELADESFVELIETMGSLEIEEID